MIKLPSAPDFSGSSSRRTAIFGGIALIIAVTAVIAIANIYKKIDAEARAKQIEANQSAAEKLARQVGALLEPQRLRLKALAQKPNIVAALSAEKAVRDKIAAEEQPAFTSALLLRLLPRGADHVDPNSKPPLTFASVDMLQAAARSEKT